MRRDEKTAEVLGRRGRGNYEQNLDVISRRGKKDVGENRPEHIEEGKWDESLQVAVTV